MHAGYSGSLSEQHDLVGATVFLGSPASSSNIGAVLPADGDYHPGCCKFQKLPLAHSREAAFHPRNTSKLLDDDI